MSIMSEQDCVVEKMKRGTEEGQKKPLSLSKPRAKLGKTHQDFWIKRLRKRTFTDSQGNKAEIPTWQVRMKYLRREAWFNLETSNAAQAAIKARDIWLSLLGQGWEATLAKFKPKAEVKAELSLDDFATLYRNLIPSVEYPPSRPTAERYLKSLFFICRRVRVNKIEDLKPEKVEDFSGKYLEEGRRENRQETSIKTTINFHIRNAGALFSRQMLEAYEKHGLALSNPFTGQKMRRVEIKAYSPMRRELLDEIWRDAPKLRDGDPSIPERVIIRTGGRKAKLPPDKKAKRWQLPDFHDPHPDAYALLLLELGLGLRRHEADKAEWDWFFELNGRHYLEVKETPFFKPKSGEKRTIPVEPVLFEAIQKTRNHAGPWIVPGRLPKRYEPGEEPRNITYRCDKAHRALAAWLRQKGIEADKPCHLLRKEFGSYVATAFSLFHAQKILGHSSPDVTAAYYAGLTDLPELKHAKLKA